MKLIISFVFSRHPTKLQCPSAILWVGNGMVFVYFLHKYESCDKARSLAHGLKLDLNFTLKTTILEYTVL